MSDLTIVAAELQVGDVIEGRTISSIQRNGWGYDINFLGYSEAGPQWFDYADAIKIQRPWKN